MRTIGIYGGSFDPPHVGHAMVAQWAVLTGQVDEVWFVPAYKHVFGKDSTDFDARVRLLRALCASLGSVYEVSTIEEGLPEPHYSIQTLNAVQALIPDAQFRFIMGADTYSERHKWHGWADIEAHYDPIVLNREGYPTVNPDAPEITGVSSTEIRRRIAEGGDISLLVPVAVRKALGV